MTASAWDEPGGSGRPTGDPLAPVLAAMLAGLAVLRLLTPHAPDRFFDIDPALAAGPFPALGAGGSLLFDAILLSLCGVALWRTGRREGGLDRATLVLVLGPLPWVLWHAGHDVLQAWRGLDWFAAAVLGVTLAHLVRLPDARRLVLVVLLGGVVAMGVRGAWQVFVEHADTVAYFEANREEVLASRGWSEDSPAARSYERRLRQPEATGWLGFSNVFSGLAGVGAVSLIGLLAAWRTRRPPHAESGGPVLLGLAGVGLAMLLGLNGSKAAIVATGLAVAMLGFVLGPGRDRRPGVLGKWVVGLGGLAFAAIVLRGLGPEDLLGDRSLLFRWHYLEGAASMLAERPWVNPWVGVGPDGFQDAYVRHKPLRSPESVASAHSMAVDWIASWGVVGLSWLLLAATMLVRAERAAGAGDIPAEPRSRISTAGWRPLVLAVAAAAAVLGWQATVESPLDGVSLASRFAAASLGVLVALVLSSVVSILEGAVLRRIALAAVVVIVVQGQVEMLFWQPGSVFACWAFLAAAGTVRGTGTTAVRRPPWHVVAVVSILAVSAGVSAVLGVEVIRESQRRQEILEPLFGRGLAGDPVGPGLRREVAGALTAGVDADVSWWDDRGVRGAIGQYMLAGSADDIRAALRLAGVWADRRPGPIPTSGEAAVAMAAWRRDRLSPDEVLPRLDRAIEFDPTDPRRRLDRAEILLALGRPAEARDALDRVRRLDEAMSLDPLVRLGDRESARWKELSNRAAPEAVDQSPRP